MYEETKEEIATMAKSTKRSVYKATLKGCTRLNVRSGRYTDASVVGVLNTSDRIKVDTSETAPDSDWIRVLEPISGFASAKFLAVEV